MLIFDRSQLAACCLLAFTSLPAHALDPSKQPEGVVPPVETFMTTKDALRDGMKRLNSGDKPGAVKVFNFAATKGDPLAQWTLGRMYANGDGVEQDDYKAFQYFSQIANAHADEANGSIMAGVVAKAFVQLGSYYLDGIPNSPVRPNPARAHQMFYYAASYFGDADAQYNVGRIYLDGVTGPKDAKQAARWLNLSAERGHRYAQAVLGQILFNGQDVPRQRPLGLSWMILAADGVEAAKDAWIVELKRKADSVASEDERRLAEGYARKFVKSGSRTATAAAPVLAAPPAASAAPR